MPFAWQLCTTWFALVEFAAAEGQEKQDESSKDLSMMPKYCDDDDDDDR